MLAACLPRTTYYLPLATGYYLLLATGYYLLLAAGYLLLATCYLLLATSFAPHQVGLPASGRVCRLHHVT
jgi:hypothetical protein